MFLVFIPRFAKLFTDMGREMPPSMDFLLTLSSIMSWLWWLLPLGCFILWKAALMYFGQSRVKAWKSSVFLKFPVAGKLVIQMELSRFIRTLAVLLGNHVEIIHSVRIAVKVIQNQTIRSSFDKLESMLKGGKKLSGALQGNAFLPPGLVSKIRVGEETGETGAMLGHIADQMEDDARKKIKRLLNAFEPLVIVCLAMIVAVVVLSIFMAIMDLNAA
jgi:type II secretory pathway component PulF